MAQFTGWPHVRVTAGWQGDSRLAELTTGFWTRVWQLAGVRGRGGQLRLQDELWPNVRLNFRPNVGLNLRLNSILTLQFLLCSISISL